MCRPVRPLAGIPKRLGFAWFLPEWPLPRHFLACFFAAFLACFLATLACFLASLACFFAASLPCFVTPSACFLPALSFFFFSSSSLLGVAFVFFLGRLRCVC